MNDEYEKYRKKIEDIFKLATEGKIEFKKVLTIFTQPQAIMQYLRFIDRLSEEKGSYIRILTIHPPGEEEISTLHEIKSNSKIQSIEKITFDENVYNIISKIKTIIKEEKIDFLLLQLAEQYHKGENEFIDTIIESLVDFILDEVNINLLMMRNPQLLSEKQLINVLLILSDWKHHKIIQTLVWTKFYIDTVYIQPFLFEELDKEKEEEILKNIDIYLESCKLWLKDMQNKLRLEKLKPVKSLANLKKVFDNYKIDLLTLYIPRRRELKNPFLNLIINQEINLLVVTEK